MPVWVLSCALPPQHRGTHPAPSREGCSPPLTKLEALCIQEPAA